MMKRRVLSLVFPVVALAALGAGTNIQARATADRLAVALQQQPTPQGGQDEFVPVDQLPKPQEQLPAAPLLIAAYVFVWLMLLLYVFTLWRRLGRVEREIASVSRQIESTRRD